MYRSLERTYHRDHTSVEACNRQAEKRVDIYESGQHRALSEARDFKGWLLTGCRNAKVGDEEWTGMMRKGKDARSLDVTTALLLLDDKLVCLNQVFDMTILLQTTTQRQ